MFDDEDLAAMQRLKDISATRDVDHKIHNVLAGDLQRVLTLTGRLANALQAAAERDATRG